MADFDVIVIGAGPGGYVCAVRCAQLGLETAVVEGRDTLGGTCLNVGCIPSKALLHASHMLHEAEHNFATMGLVGATPGIDWQRMLAYKRETVDGNTRGIDFLFEKNGITWLKGWGSIAAPGRVRVGGDVHTARHIVIASGSETSPLDGVVIDEKTVVTSTGALELDAVPASMIVIGAGVIGLELASVYARLGADVTVLEYLDEIASGMDGDVRRVFRRILETQGLTFVTGAAVRSAVGTGDGAEVVYRSRRSGVEECLKADVVLLATGRRPFTDGLGLDELGVGRTRSGQIAVDDRFATSVAGIHAIGDVVPGPMLAHKAEDDGVAIAELLAGRRSRVDHDLVPSVVYTHPEVAAVGRTEERLRLEGADYKVGRFPFTGNGRARGVFAREGFVKLLADTETDRVLGCHLIGPAAGDLVHEVCVGMRLGATADDIARTCHAHPTFSEAVREAALACGDGAIHA